VPTFEIPDPDTWKDERGGAWLPNDELLDVYAMIIWVRATLHDCPPPVLTRP
jgi:hypothetical protein